MSGSCSERKAKIKLLKLLRGTKPDKLSFGSIEVKSI